MDIRVGEYIIQGLDDNMYDGLLVGYSKQDDVGDWRIRKFSKLLKSLMYSEILILVRSLPKDPLGLKAKRIIRKFLGERCGIEFE
jgi:hypothetical protein